MKTLRIDFVSDVVCPWCAIGLASLEQALQRTQGEVAADIHFQPFELNPQLPAEGEGIGEHLQRKYGMSEAQLDENQERIRARGAELGVVFDFNARSRIFNTFDAHRLLHWAGIEGRQAELKHALLRAYFSEGRNVSQSMDAAGLTTPVALRMLNVGEKSGNMGEMLEQIAAFHDEELARWVDWFTRLFEPILMAIIGLVIGAIVILMYMPIFELAGNLQ